MTGLVLISQNVIQERFFSPMSRQRSLILSVQIWHISVPLTIRMKIIYIRMGLMKDILIMSYCGALLPRRPLRTIPAWHLFPVCRQRVWIWKETDYGNPIEIWMWRNYILPMTGIP